MDNENSVNIVSKLVDLFLRFNVNNSIVTFYSCMMVKTPKVYNHAVKTDLKFFNTFFLNVASP
jgi:hypothetical protein